MMREIELLQQQFQDAANQFPGLMHIWILHSEPRPPLTHESPLREQIITFSADWGPPNTIGCLWEYWFIRREHHKWNTDDAIRQFEWLAGKAHIRAHLLRELLPEMDQGYMARFFGERGYLIGREDWLVDVYRLNLLGPLSKSDDHFWWFCRPEKCLVDTIHDQLRPSEADIFYLDDVFLESAFACSNLLELLSLTEVGQKPKAKELPRENIRGKAPGDNNGLTKAKRLKKAKRKTPPAKPERESLWLALYEKTLKVIVDAVLGILWPK